MPTISDYYRAVREHTKREIDATSDDRVMADASLFQDGAFHLSQRTPQFASGILTSGEATNEGKVLRLGVYSCRAAAIC